MNHLAGRNGGKQHNYNQLKGPKPPPVNTDRRPAGGPVIVYVKSPDVIHVRPEEFMGLVQSLTGKRDDAGPNAPTSVMPAPVDDMDFSHRLDEEEWTGDQAPRTSNNYYISGTGNDVNYSENWEGYGDY